MSPDLHVKFPWGHGHSGGSPNQIRIYCFSTEKPQAGWYANATSPLSVPEYK